MLSLILAELLFVFGIDKIQYQVMENAAANNPLPRVYMRLIFSTAVVNVNKDA